MKYFTFSILFLYRKQDSCVNKVYFFYIYINYLHQYNLITQLQLHLFNDNVLVHNISSQYRIVADLHRSFVRRSLIIAVTYTGKGTQTEKLF